MGKVIDPVGTEEHISQPAARVLEQTKHAMEAKKMENAIQVHTPHQIAAEQAARTVTPMEMLDRAVSSGAGVETLTQLMALQERWEANQARKAFDEAMAMAKANMPSIVKTKKVDFTTQKGRTNYQYEDLASIMNQIGPVLSANGLSVRYRTQAEPNQPISVTCIISHRMGHSEENTLMAGRDDSGNKNSIQAIGSTVTYLQRYTLKAALGLAAAADDDGANSDQTVDETKTITEAQASVIRELIEKAELETPVFCERWQVEAVADIPLKQFNEVVGSLRQRVAYLTNQRKQGSAA
ncbi:ERF family protein [Agrobacterium vitis]|uniref:ERF family protein n=1 Tax=Agrobacterium vitis TaxID=373 RepID=UPI001572D8D6|nr:ERF family protein [Agrobacterium vitis]NSZ52944.1 ERF family protein [Agrobacterium vitis]NTA31703.1 ERF family protein [Agrobacterium vitis]